MVIKENYKQTDIGIIPEDWDVKRLGEIGESFIGLTYNPKDVGESGTLVLRSSNIKNSKLAFEDNVYVKIEIPDRVKVREDDLLICVRNGSRHLIGKCALISKKIEGNAFGAFMSIYRSTFSKYVFHQFQAKVIQKQINETLGATINQITNKDLALFQIPVPATKSEQLAITNTLSEADALISSLERLIAKKRNIKQGTMQKLLKPKEGWISKTFGELFTFLKTTNNSRAELLVDGEIGYIHYGDIHTKWKYYLDCKKDSLPFIEKSKVKNVPFLEEGDLIMADASEDYEGLGACIEIRNLENRKIVAGLHTLLLRGNRNLLADGFKGYILNISGVKDAIIRISTGISVYSLAKMNLKNIEIQIPPTIEEQLYIASIITDMGAEISTLETKLEKYKMIKQGMMQNLLTGKIRLL